ncbi:MAG: halogenase [Litorilinea sp.]|nr:MAG: halogenase [Litorilinea sp.]
METNTNHYHVVIIGSGIAGSSLGAILARHGLRVLILEAGSHPRFAIGESMILETSETMRAMAEFFHVPELAYFSSEHYFPYIGTTHGVKRHFSYLYHVPGQPQDPRQSLQAVIPRQPHGHELHLYRQDCDYYLSSVAVAYGATLLQQTRVEDVRLHPDRVEVIAGGRSFTADYVVDAGGYRSVLAQKLDLRDHNLQTHSRGLFTHMIDVPCFHQVHASRRAYGVPFRVSEGTLHHVFRGGWLWVIPFNNHPRSTNPLCSVGLMLDPRIYPPQPELSPEEEFRTFISRFPSIQAQFQGAKAVRPWTRADRIQYSAKQVVGDRFCLLGHAAGFIDPLFSKGLYTSLMSVAVLADLLLEAHRDGDYSASRFQPLETLTLGYIRTNDRLIANSFKSFSNYKLWSVYAVLWLLGAYTELVKLTSARLRAPDRQAYFAELRCLRLAGGGFPEFFAIADEIDTVMEQTDPDDEEAVDAAVGAMKERLAQVSWMPQPFAEVLAGKNHLPKNKLRPTLLRTEHGFMGSGDYRRHFFGDATEAELVRVFLAEKVKYAALTLGLRKRLQWRRLLHAASPGKSAAHSFQE